MFRPILSALTALFLFLCLAPRSAEAQTPEKRTISGYVRDAGSGEDIIGANIVLVRRGMGGSTNQYGYYTITAPVDTYTVRVSHLGHKRLEVQVNLQRDTVINFELESESRKLEVEVRSDAPRQQLERAQMSKVDLSIQTIKQLPAIFGEVDILKSLQLLPGVQSGSEGTTGFFVRGGGPDQNLIILDEAVVYNANHLFGFFSVFNSDAVKNVELYKGGFPARFGGRLSSVVDVNLKEGNKKKLSGSGGIGLIASRFTLEGPLVKDKASFIVSARRTYVDVFTRQYNRIYQTAADFRPIPDYYFYDLNGKANYEISEKDRVFLSGYFGRDVFGFNQGNFDFAFNWGNATGTARWNHIYNSKLFSNVTATFTDYRYKIGNNSSGFRFQIGSLVQDWTGKMDFEYVPSTRHHIRFGASFISHKFGVGTAEIQLDQNAPPLNFEDFRYGSEMGLYASDDWDITRKLKLDYGLRMSAFAGQDGSFYYGPEPRTALRYKVSENVSLKASYTGMNQYVHLVSNSGASLPTDIWYPSNKTVKPQFAQQAAAGVTTLLFGEKILLTDEVFFKTMSNQIDYKDGAQIFLNKDLDKEFVFGQGWSYGNEILLQKQSGALTGWVGYTLSWTWRQFDAINDGEKFNPKYDQRHYITVVGSYEVNKRLVFSATWVYGTGTLTTLPVGYIYLNNIEGSNPQVTPIIDKRNNTRLPAYHRMDISAVWKFKPKWGDADLTFSVYNLYNRRNAFLLYIDQEFSQNTDLPGLRLPVKNTAKQIALFPIIPSVTFNFKF